MSDRLMCETEGQKGDGGLAEFACLGARFVFEGGPSELTAICLCSITKQLVQITATPEEEVIVILTN